MSYLKITSLDSYEWHRHDVSDDEILVFQEAKQLLTHYLDMEIIFDQVIEEFWEYHNKVDYWRIRSVTKPQDFNLNHEIRSSLNRLAFNVLNLGKLYLDKHFNDDKKMCFASELTNSEENYKLIEKQRSEIYDNNLCYVVGCKLRNNSQHRMLPVSTFTSGVKNDMANNETWISFVINYQCEDLVEAKVPKEMISKDTVLDLTEIIEGYIYAVSEMRSLNKKLTEGAVADAKQKINAIIEPRAQKTKYKTYMSEFELESGEIVYADLEWFDVSKYLELKHPFSVDYSRFNYGKRNKWC